MNIIIHSNSDSSFSYAARYIVREFVHENPIPLGKSDITMRERYLAEQLIKIYQSYGQPSEKTKLELFMSEEILPQDMKAWALAKKVLDIKKLDFDMISEISTESTSQLSEYSCTNRVWDDVELVQKAKDGHRGAWFFVNSKRGAVVVKGQESADEQLMGTLFLRFCGMHTPDARLVRRSSAEGIQLSALGEQHGLNARQPTHYIVMNRVKGPSYGNLTSSAEHLQLVTKTLSDLGELAIYDLVLGNYDRFQLDTTSFNAGNIMFENDILCPIDTDCVFDPERFGLSKLLLKKVIEGKGAYEDKIAKKLAQNLGPGVSEEMISSVEIKKGMNKAIEKLMSLSENMDGFKLLFLAQCKERGCETIFPQHLEQLILHIKSCKISQK